MTTPTCCELDDCTRDATTLLTQAHTGVEGAFCVGITLAVCHIHARQIETCTAAAVASLRHEGTVYCAHCGDRFPRTLTTRHPLPEWSHA